jgi:hypothetical protein
MRASALRGRSLRGFIILLALIDGAVHLELDRLLFGGDILSGRVSESFALNFVGYLGLVGLVLIAPSLLVPRQWLAYALLGVYALASIGAWIYFGGPNPMGPGHLDKGLEIVLLIAIAIHLTGMWSDGRGIRSHTAADRPGGAA